MSLDETLVRDFEAAKVNPAQFRHREHLFVAWSFLKDAPLEEALARYVRGLQRLVTALGVPEKFHRTMTWGYLVLLDEAMRRTPNVGFEELLGENPHLLSATALHAHYSPEELATERARTQVVLPRRERGNER